MLRRFVIAVVDLASRFPFVVVALALAIAGALGAYASRLELRSDLLELLPRDSPGFLAFEHQLGRVGGGSTLIVIVSSPDRAKNEAFVDDLAADLDLLAKREPRIAYVESGTKDVRSFYEANKWLYASLDDLQKADRDLDTQIAIQSGLVVDLEAPSTPPSVAPVTKQPALGLSDSLERWEDRSSARDSFPTGYFATPDGKLLGLRIVTNTTLGDAHGDAILAEVERVVSSLDVVHRYHAEMRIGFTGDVASAAGEKKAIVSDAAWATALALGVILVAIVFYFRSLWSIPVIALPVLLGVTAAYAFAQAVFGHINTSGAFLGAIILGNGINYPIVLLSRYQEFRARGMAPDDARREAVLNAFRAELVGACVAAIAYGSLVVTSFRGFRQFGAIGFVGMLCIWIAIVPLVPAALVVVERLQARLPQRLRDRAPKLADDGGRRGLPEIIARAVAKHATWIVAAGLALTVVAALKIPRYVRDPWEYDFGRLGSRRSEESGAGEWSNKANEVFGGKMNIAGALMLADTPEQVPLLKAQMLANDARDPEGPLLAEIATIDDLLPGPADEQRARLEVLASIRARLTPDVIDALGDAERPTVLRARPPEALHVLGREDLPPLLRRRFMENDGRLGTVFYVKPRNDVVFADGHNHLRLAKTTDNVSLADGTVVMTASRSTIFAEMLTSMRRDGPLASIVAFVAVVVVVAFAARDVRVVASVLVALVVGVIALAGFAAYLGIRIHYVNFVAFPITLGIGCEYPFNIADRVRLLGGDIGAAVRRSGGAVMLCSFTTAVGYGSLLLSDFQALESFGKLAVAGEIACVVAAVVFLPALLTLVSGRALPTCGATNRPVCPPPV